MQLLQDSLKFFGFHEPLLSCMSMAERAMQITAIGDLYVHSGIHGFPPFFSPIIPQSYKFCKICTIKS